MNYDYFKPASPEDANEYNLVDVEVEIEFSDLGDNDINMFEKGSVKTKKYDDHETTIAKLVVQVILRQEGRDYYVFFDDVYEEVYDSLNSCEYDILNWEIL